MFYKIGVLKNLQNLLEKICTGVSFWRPATLLKQDSRTDVFYVFAKSLRTSVLQNICKRVPLKKEASAATTRSEACQKYEFFVQKSWFFDI